MKLSNAGCGEARSGAVTVEAAGRNGFGPRRCDSETCLDSRAVEEAASRSVGVVLAGAEVRRQVREVESGRCRSGTSPTSADEFVRVASAFPLEGRLEMTGSRSAGGASSSLFGLCPWPDRRLAKPDGDCGPADPPLDLTICWKLKGLGFEVERGRVAPTETEPKPFAESVAGAEYRKLCRANVEGETTVFLAEGCSGATLAGAAERWEGSAAEFAVGRCGGGHSRSVAPEAPARSIRSR